MNGYDYNMLKAMLGDLLAMDAGLTDWEIDFIDNLNKWRGSFTAGQEKALVKIWHRRAPDNLITQRMGTPVEGKGL